VILLEADGVKGKGGSEGGNMPPVPLQTLEIVHLGSSSNFLKLQIGLFFFITTKPKKEHKNLANRATSLLSPFLKSCQKKNLDFFFFPDGNIKMNQEYLVLCCFE